MNSLLSLVKIRLLIPVISILAMIVMLAPGLYGQENVPLDSLLAKVQPIPIAEISVEATATSSLLAEKRNILLPDEEIARIDEMLDSTLVRYEILINDPKHQKHEEMNIRELETLSKNWKAISSNLEQRQTELTRTVESLENDKAALQIHLRQWNLTLELAERENSPETVREQIASTIQSIERMLEELNEDSDFLQAGLVKVSEKLISSNEFIHTFQISLEQSTLQRFKFDKPVIWKDSLYVKDTALAEPGYIGANLPVIKGFFNENVRKLEVHLGLLILIVILSFVLFRRLQRNIAKKDEKYVARTRILMSKPGAASLMIAFTFTIVWYENIPQVIRSFNAVLVLIPMTILIAHNIHQSIRKYIYLLMVFILLTVLHDLTYQEDLFSRLLMLVIHTGSLITVIFMLRDKPVWEIARKSFTLRLLYNLLYIVGLFMGISVFTNVFGGAYIAEYFGDSTLYSIVVALLVYAFIAIVNGILIMIIYSKGVSSLTVIKNFGPTVEKRLTGIVALIGWIIWVVAVLQEFMIKDDVFAWLNKVFISPITIGSTQINLLNIILFFFIIWLTISISRIIRFFLEGDVFTRMKLRKGVPGAISLMLRISIITIGFLIAIAAAGVQMEKLAILLGAFGVGIGFGLQNIFNNLISGIILAFERPINEGDIIEVGALMGIVQEIGIRSSIIKTYDGSEVIVPNGNLISEQLINWTLSDQRRRGEVLVGVAYGTDPQKVLDLLLEAAESNERVLEHPKPWAIFLGFGESSLDFRLLFWIADADTRLTIQSEVTVKVNQLIKAAGIEIPFPQRDLHLRSAEAKIFDRISAVDESIRKKTGEEFPKPGRQKKEPGK
jgi:small-conductance mechanosensitive channel